MRFFFDRNMSPLLARMVDVLDREHTALEQAWKFIKVWPDIVEHAKGAAPRIFEISGGAGLKIERKHI